MTGLALRTLLALALVLSALSLSGLAQPPHLVTQFAGLSR